MELLSHINSPYLIQTIGICLNYEFRGYQRPTIVLEYAPNGSLQEIIQSYEHYPNENWTDTKKLICIYGIAAGMEYLHSENIIHRNLKPENILLDKFLHPKITGFGLSRISNIDMEKSMSKGVGTFQFMAPEIMNEDEYSSKVDVFSFGMIVHLILTGKMPFSGPFFRFIRTGILDISKKIPGVYRELISRCLSFDPKDRPTFSEIVSFLKSDKNFITEKVDKKEFLTYLGLIENDDKSEFDQVEIKFNKKVGKLTISAKQIDLSQFEKLEKIGSGGFAKVFKVADVKTGKFYAAKISILELELCDDKIITNLVQEINILSKLRTLTKLNTHSILSFIGFSRQLSLNFLKTDLWIKFSNWKEKGYQLKDGMIRRN